MECCKDCDFQGPKETLFQAWAGEELEALSQKNPEFGEIAESLGVKETEIAEMDQRLTYRDLSLDSYIGQEGETSHLDYLTYEGRGSRRRLRY